MASKLVAEYAQSADALIKALRAAKKTASDGAHATFDSMIAESEHVPDLGFTAELFARRLEHDRAELERAEEAKGSEAADAHEPRAARDAAAQELYATLLEVRRTIGALFGPTWIKTLQFPADLHQNAVGQLVRAGKDVMKALKDRALPKPNVEGVRAIDPKPWQKRIKQAVKDLEAANAALGDESQDLDAANVAKANAVARFERTFAAASQFAASALTLASDDDGAEAVPRHPRKARKVKAVKRAPAPQPPNGAPAPEAPPGAAD